MAGFIESSSCIEEFIGLIGYLNIITLSAKRFNLLYHQMRLIVDINDYLAETGLHTILNTVSQELLSVDLQQCFGNVFGYLPESAPKSRGEYHCLIDKNVLSQLNLKKPFPTFPKKVPLT